MTGRVQGVGYRYFVIQAVRGLAISGWVRNMPQGSVEVCAEGSGDDLSALRAALEKGPSLGRVKRVREGPAPPTGESSFRIKH